MPEGPINYGRQQARERTGKFTDEDVMMDAGLRGAAVAYAETYSGGFTYMLEQQATLGRRRSLSIGQMRGVLNCLRAETLRADDASQDAVSPTDEAGFALILALFATAASSLKHPRIRLITPVGLDGRSTTVALSIAGDRSKEPGTIVVTNGGSWDARVYFGRVRTDGTFDRRYTCPPEVTELLIRFAADPAGVAAEYGKLTGHCCFCAAELSADNSTEVGYGPICAKRYGLPWGAATAKKAAVA